MNTDKKGTHEIYKVLQIADPDFGCEGRPEGYEPLAEVKLMRADGSMFFQKEKDRLLYEREIEEGNFVCETEEGLLKYQKTIVCYGDSNTYGYNPETGMRYPKNVRWTGRLAEALEENYNVIEEGCNGRTTIFDDPVEGWKNGKNYVKPCLNSHKPVDMVILMLGSNDLKNVFHASAEEIADGIRQVVEEIYEFADQKQGFRPTVVLVAPPVIGDGICNSPFSYAFDETAIQRSKKFAVLYEQVVKDYDCRFVDAAKYICSSKVDSLHFSAESHAILADVLLKACRID